MGFDESGRKPRKGGEPKSIKKLRSGDLLIETLSTVQNKSFLLAKTFIDSPLVVTFHRTLNSCRGVISESDLLCASKTEILEDSKICPKWKIEKQIQELKTNKNISYPEARKLIVPQSSQTYAQAAKSSTLNNSTQTDENITKINCPPLKLLAPLSSKRRTNIPTAVTTSSSAQTQLLPSISSKTSTISNPQPPTPMSETKGKIKEQPSPLHRLRKDNKK
ncbi:putative RNA-directed DNA polymerase from transposon BS [Trichonephila clavipes]|nr:putative RNA-directed DNA polymerase from transposon BS [Trichonephila clavipes]